MPGERGTGADVGGVVVGGVVADSGSGSDGGRGAVPPLPRFAAVPVAVVVTALTVVLTALSGRYGFHRDELYFLVAGDHPAWGYVDQPPLTPLLARAATAAFGETPEGLRVAATLLCAATVVVVALVARELGGGRGAQVLAALCASVSGYVLGVGHLVSTSTLDLLVWLLICWLVLRVLRTGDGRWWVAVGAVSGVGLQNKYLVVLLLAVALVAIAAVGPRPVLRSRWLAAGAAVAVLLALPNVWWQAAHDWPQLTVAGGISEDDGAENRLMFVPQQLMYLSPLLVPVWVAGIVSVWRDPALRWARAVVVAYALLCVAVPVSGGKPYYALPVLIVLMAAGCAPVLRWSRQPGGGRGRGAGRRGAVVAALAVSLVVDAVITLPVLPADAVNPVLAINPEPGEQIGWPALADAAADGWSKIPAGQRGEAVIFTSNYGEAGAIARYGPERGLPAPYSGHMSHADWGPPPDSADGPVLLVYQDGTEGRERYFTGCREVARVDNGEGVDNEEQNAVVALCAGPARPWSALWPDLRRFY